METKVKHFIHIRILKSYVTAQREVTVRLRLHMELI